MTLNERIRHFYDTSTKLWLDTWGEHMHHGHYGDDGKEKKDPQQAQTDLVNKLLLWGNVQEASRILDAGCGVGGSARYLAKLYSAKVKGLTLSPVQVTAANIYNEKAGLDDQVEIVEQDLLTLTAADGPFDLVWSMESGEHIPEKRQMLERFYEVLSPGGKFLLATWCIRHEPPALRPEERQLLDTIGELYHLPPMISIEKYREIAQEVGFTNVQSADWSAAVAPFWKAVIQSAFSLPSFVGLVRAGIPAIKGAWAMQYMTKGYRMNTLKFGVIQGTKP